MKCDGSPCVNCGQVDSSECTAEVPLAELIEMEAGRIPRRAVIVTRAQLAALRNQPIELSADEKAELFTDLDDPTLIGNRIAALTKALGIPPCGACGKRRDWLNAAHAWLRGAMA
jgi:hypothetical protein